MSSFEENTHAFIVRVWREPREIEGAPPEWRGMIEHVGTGRRRYIKDLREITDFMALYLEQLGVVTISTRLRRWLKRP